MYRLSKTLQTCRAIRYIHLKWRKSIVLSPLFVLHSEKLWTVDVSNDTRRFEADIEASSLSATWPRIEKTYNIFWMVSENRDICIPRDTIPGMFSHRARQPTSHPEICMYCIASFVSLLIFFNSVTNDQEAGEEEEERLFLFISWKGDPSLFDTSMRSFTGNVSIRHWTVLMRIIYNFLYGGWEKLYKEK